MSEDSKESISTTKPTLDHGRLKVHEEENARTWIDTFGGVRRTRFGGESTQKTKQTYLPLKSKKDA